jgi:hypothetical protein
MKTKLIGILVITLLISSITLSVSGMINFKQNLIVNKELIENEDQSLGVNMNDGDWDTWTNVPHMFSIPEGNVGIGTNNPIHKLHVKSIGRGGIIIEGDNTGDLIIELNNMISDHYIFDDGPDDGNNLRIESGVGKDIIFNTNGNNEKMRITDIGRIGIGTDNPQEKLHVDGSVQMSGFKMTTDASSSFVLTSDSSGVGTWQPASSGGEGDEDWEWSSGSGLDGIIYHLGNVGIGTDNPHTRYMLDVAGDIRLKESLGSTNLIIDADDEVNANILFRRNGDNRWIFQGDWSTNDLLLKNYATGESSEVMFWDYETGNVGIGTSDADEKLVVDGSIKLTGGSDIAEPFEISNAEKVKPGMIVVIDSEKPGNLKISDKEYDRCVAGIVSGAGGINPGLMITQKELFSGINIALAGRVYGLCDASYGSIKPGDLLTTSPTFGYAMKIKNYNLAQGATLGKAMTLLENGRGLVLILVALQ